MRICAVYDWCNDCYTRRSFFFFLFGDLCTCKVRPFISTAAPVYCTSRRCYPVSLLAFAAARPKTLLLSLFWLTSDKVIMPKVVVRLPAVGISVVAVRRFLQPEAGPPPRESRTSEALPPTPIFLSTAG